MTADQRRKDADALLNFSDQQLTLAHQAAVIGAAQAHATLAVAEELARLRGPRRPRIQSWRARSLSPLQ